mmetsp:Transcript_59619/g.167951  ORF Transcript_59619/g.167951 Transcript_59619/m.167951 type:complete len:345 (+) Transcript_59619:74-1108(+)
MLEAFSDGEAEAWERSSIANDYSRTEQVVYRGLGSTIFLGVFGTTSSAVAIKILMKSNFDSDAELKAATNEVAIHAVIPPHPNVIRLLAAEETPVAFLLVMPYAPCGDLWELTKFGHTYCEAEVRNCAAQMLHALHHIHTTCSLVHGDIKPHNFLLVRCESKHVLQLCDFGLAVHPDSPDGTVTFRGLRGTSGWIAPELLQSRDYNHLVDLFGCGLILFRMLGGYRPFEPPANFTGGVEFDDCYWCHVSDLCRQFLGLLLSVDPAGRPSAANAREHPWIMGPAPAEPSAEQLMRLAEFGPPPVRDFLFWWPLPAGLENPATAPAPNYEFQPRVRSPYDFSAMQY